MHWLLMPYKRYSVTHGRSRRMEFWSYQLAWWAVLLAIIYIDRLFAPASTGATAEVSSITLWLAGLWIFGNIVPSIAVTIRRWHDLGQTGWLFLVFGLLSIIPGLNIILALCNIIWFFMPGVVGENKWGPDPKE